MPGTDNANATSWLWWDKCLCRAGSSNMPSYMPVISLRPGCMPGYMSLAAMRPHSLSIARFKMQCPLPILLFDTFHCITLLLCTMWALAIVLKLYTERIAKSKWTWVCFALPDATQRMIRAPQPLYRTTAMTLGNKNIIYIKR